MKGENAVFGIVIVAALCLQVACGKAFASPTYKIADLGTLGGATSYGLSVNNSGQTVGYSDTGALINGGPVSHAFVTDNLRKMVDLDSRIGGVFSVARSINNSGIAVGYTEGHAFAASIRRPLTGLPGIGRAPETALGINDFGQIVGASWVINGGGGPGSPHASLLNSKDPFNFSYPDEVIDLQTLGGANSVATDINNNGQIVGSSQVGSGNTHAFVKNLAGSMIDLGTLGGRESAALSVNDAGQIVGMSDVSDNSGQHAFLADADGHLVDLGTLGGKSSWAYGINIKGQIVGDSLLPGNSAQHAFVTVAGVVTDLNDLIDPSSIWTLFQARGINDNGQIVGTGINSFGQIHAFLATPVPLPSAVWLLSSALVGFSGAVRVLGKAGSRLRYMPVRRNSMAE